jgi:hypothetical protein
MGWTKRERISPASTSTALGERKTDGGRDRKFDGKTLSFGNPARLR